MELIPGIIPTYKTKRKYIEKITPKQNSPAHLALRNPVGIVAGRGIMHEHNNINDNDGRYNDNKYDTHNNDGYNYCHDYFYYYTQCSNGAHGSKQQRYPDLHIIPTTGFAVCDRCRRQQERSGSDQRD